MFLCSLNIHQYVYDLSGQAHCPCGQSLLRCPRCSQLHHQAFGQGQGTQVRACTWSQVIQRIQEVDHTITISVYLLTRLGICRYQPSSVSVKRGGAVWKKIYTSFHYSLTQHMRVIGRHNPLAIWKLRPQRQAYSGVKLRWLPQPFHSTSPVSNGRCKSIFVKDVAKSWSREGIPDTLPLADMSFFGSELDLNQWNRPIAIFRLILR